MSAYYNIKSKRGKERGPEWPTIKYLLEQYYTTQEDFKFEDFIDFIVSPENEHPGKYYFDRHWDSYLRSCRACTVNYTFITRTETSAEDSKPILKLLEYPENYLQNRTHKNHIQRQNSSTILNQGTMLLPRYGTILSEYRKISSDALLKLYERYKSDLQGFGYFFDEKTNAAYCAIRTENEEVCC